MTHDTRFVSAIHILTLLATSETPTPSPRIAGSIGVNPVTVRKLVVALREAGLVETAIGSSGGATLARPATEISLRDVYLAVREDSVFGGFPDRPSPDCQVGRNIGHVLDDLLEETERTMIAPLAAIRISDLLAQVRQRDRAVTADQ